ncbi:PLP-dependent transferase [Schizophyllum commune Loenen D]|nr:PLP-dependent transferase [Schizophyllum commune Loenen D]
MDANLNQPTPLKDMHECVSSWFLGPRAENFDLLKEIFSGVLDEHRRVREEYHPEDGTFITKSIHESKTFQENVDLLRSEIDTVSRLLNEYSVPFFSPRYMGHMIWETSLPALAGWLCTLLFNQNNVTFEASPLPVTTGNQLCSMLGYSKGDENLPESWGLDRVVELREKYARKGLTFIVHADAAWGGYFASMIRDPPEGLNNRYDDQEDEEGSRDFVPAITMREYSVRQFRALARADSITIDPHKAGYVPYPAGGLCYRDGRMRFLLTWTAPYLHDSDNGESIGVYGIEGSKPGAAAIACYLHNTVVGLHKLGHGALLGEISFTCRRGSP